MPLASRIVVSNIAWTSEEELQIAHTLQKLKVHYLEVAPTKIWGEPNEITDQQIQSFKDTWHHFGIQAVALQSVLFRHPEMQIFGDAANRALTQQCLREYIILASRLGASIVVFGSPKNRQKGVLGEAEAFAIAKDFFGSLGDTAQEHGVAFCIEPNAPEYGCDFITTAEQGIALVELVNNPGFRLHLDTGAMTMVGDTITSSIDHAASVLKHFHLSAPQLGRVERREDVHYEEALIALQDINYQGFISIEMRPGEQGQNIERVTTAVQFIQSSL